MRSLETNKGSTIAKHWRVTGMDRTTRFTFGFFLDRKMMGTPISTKLSKTLPIDSVLIVTNDDINEVDGK